MVRGGGGSQLGKLRDADVLFKTKFSPDDEIQLLRSPLTALLRAGVRLHPIHSGKLQAWVIESIKVAISPRNHAHFRTK